MSLRHGGRKRVLKMFAFLYEGYKLDAGGAPYGWECLIMVRKAAFMGLATGFLGLREPRTQLVQQRQVAKEVGGS